MKLPNRFLDVLKTNTTIYSIVLDVISSYEPILKDNKLYFFEEYTDHGLEHIERVIEATDFIITQQSYECISSYELAILVLSIILHDIGMQIELPTFRSMIEGDYDRIRVISLDEKTWAELWSEYLAEVKRFSTIQKIEVFGTADIPFTVLQLSNKDRLTGFDKKVIGEFLRRHHGRLAQEIAIEGIIGGNGRIEFGSSKVDHKTRQLVGILARSHSMDIRSTFSYLEEIAHDSWRNPHNVNIVYLMVLLRIADYIQIGSDRATYLLKLKSLSSPISQLEHKQHLTINSLNFNQVDAEKVYVDCSPTDSKMYVKIDRLIYDIQNELDKSWAILGEVYGFIPNNKPSIRFRRISSNLRSKTFLNSINYIPQQVSFRVDTNLSRLLVNPLYGDNPTYGVRELLQNAIDACLERREIECQVKNYNYEAQISVSISELDNERSLFVIKDNGKGMSTNEIINFFLNVGSSFRKSMEWKKQFVSEEGKSKINRNGKFGIGVLASFLLGDEIVVSTKSLTENRRLKFSCTIESQYINIIASADDSDDFGTTISIVMNDEREEQLLYPPHYPSTISWNSWYVFDEPKITYSVNDEILVPENRISKMKFYDFSTNDFEEIKWSYSKYNNARFRDHIAVCNGILISEDYSFDSFFYNDDEDIFPMVSDYRKDFVITDKPSIMVIDKEGILPVKLDRNDLDSVPLPFETELLSEVSKHFIAEVLHLPLDGRSLHNVELLHKAGVLFGHEGFTLSSDYFIDGVKNSYQLVRLITSRSRLEFDLSKYKNCLFTTSFNDRINLTYQDPTVGPNVGGRILLPRENFDALFRGEKRRIAASIRNSTTILKEDSKYVLYEVFGYSRPPAILNNIEALEKQLLESVLSIQELPFHFFYIMGGRVLNDLFAKYIKKHYIIPYDINKRKKMYPEAFSDLEKYV